MSLRPNDRSSRARGSSVSQERSRSRGDVRTTQAPSPPTYGYHAQGPLTSSSNMPGSFDAPTYEVRTPQATSNDRTSYVDQSHKASSAYQSTAHGMSYPEHDDTFTMGGYKDLPPHERPGYVPPQGQYASKQRREDNDLAYGAPPPPDDHRSSAYLASSQHQSHAPEDPRRDDYRYQIPQADAAQRSASYTYQHAIPPDRSFHASHGSVSAQSTQYSHAPPAATRHLSYTTTPQGQFHDQLPRNYAHNAYDQHAHVVDITPGHEADRRYSSVGSDHLTAHTRHASLQVAAPSGLVPRMHSLSVSGHRPDMAAHGGGLPPASPLLEAYHGTYQSISPMPMAIRLDEDDDDLESLEQLSSVSSRHSSKVHDRLAHDAEIAREKKKRVKAYVGEEDARVIAEALKHHKVDGEAICNTLPGLSQDQVLELRKEYKKQVKVQGKGVNLSKHIKTKLTGNFGKVAYVTALGRWESEGYWANFFYQSHGSRRELLIESLMGRTNAEIREIKAGFKDKRYSDSLVKCMEKELKMDKFRTAVLMSLEERRQEEQDVYPVEYRNRDVEFLHRALTAKQGGESAMLEIIVKRSDAHLREVLKIYEKLYQENFSRAALKKSNNLVGEVIAHILNGVVNKPARDAILIHHAIKDIAEKNTDDDIRHELLISRLVRVHWDRMHLLRVKKEYYQKYRTTLEDDIDEATKSDYSHFLDELCQAKSG